MEELFRLAFLRSEKRSVEEPQVGRLTTVTAGTTEQLRVVGIRINRAETFPVLGNRTHGIDGQMISGF